MNISLPHELEAYVAKKASSGMYGSASEVIREALREHIKREQERELKLTALRAAAREGEESGEAEEWDVESFLAEED